MTNATCIGRWLIASLFIISGLGMAMNFGATSGWFASMGVPMASLATVLVLLIKVPGAIVYALGKKYSNYAGYAFIVFTVIATFMVYMNWVDQT
jgi:putative oxidoreductase